MQVVGVAQSFCEVWESVAGALAELDVLLGFADLAVNAPMAYVRPQMLPASEGRLDLQGCRCRLPTSAACACSSPAHTQHDT